MPNSKVKLLRWLWNVYSKNTKCISLENICILYLPKKKVIDEFAGLACITEMWLAGMGMSYICFSYF